MRRTLLALMLGILMFPALASARAPASPSGQPMPTTAPRGWKLAWSDDFTAASAAADPSWNLDYWWGEPGGDPGGFWDDSHFVIANGEGVLRAYRDPSDGSPAGSYVTPNILSAAAQTYGKYEVRFRMDQGTGIAGALWLTAANHVWPPEIDFSEDNGVTPRTTTYATLHYGPNNTMVQRSTAVNMTQWHTLGLEWTKGKLVYTLDGQDWATVANANVPSVPMQLNISEEGWGCGDNGWEACPNSTTPAEVDMDVDWVVVYRQS